MAYQVGDLEVSVIAQVDNAINRIEALSKALSGIKTQLDTINKGTTAGAINKAVGGGSSSKKLSTSSNVEKATSNFNVGFIFTKIKTIAQYTIKTAKAAAQILQYGVDYTETLNLWQVAMGNNLSMATEFVDKMNKAYGISEKTLMNAQAIFKNMIGSLGQISETTAYNLSEAITQMAIDYSSLYNVSIDSAITKFQAALAGQVRPIRSVSGYDITENTLYQLYQSLGGTKTMRQLSRTEKQLLSIYAVFNQMGASGALGDMGKTIDEVANQTRMMRENFEQAATWLGVSLQYILKEYEVFKYINSALIFMSELFKSIAFSLGYETPDFANSWADNVEETNKEVDKLNGKLLGFDKFRALNESEGNIFGIDSKLLEALSGYTSEIGNATNEARLLAESWMEATFWTRNQANELEFNKTKFDELAKTIGTVGSLLVAVFAGVEIKKAITYFTGALKVVKDGFVIFDLVRNAGVSFEIATAAMGGTSSAALTLGKALKFITGPVGIILSVLGLLYVANEDFRNSVNDLFASLMPLVTLTVNLVEQLLKPLTGTLSGLIGLLGTGLGWVITNIVIPSVKGLSLVIGALAVGLEAIVKVVSTLFTLLETLFTLNWGELGNKLSNIWGNWSTIGFVKNLASEMPKPIQYANDGLPDKGTMFVAGEAGAEIVYNTPSGQSGVANIEQIKQAMYGALVAYGNTHGGSEKPINVYLDGELVYKNTTSHAKRNGYVWGKA